MSDEHLHELLTRAGDDGRADAQARAWAVVQQAFADDRDARANASSPRSADASGIGGRPAPRGLLAAAAVATAALVVAIAVSSPGAAVAHWLRDQIIGKPGVEHPAPALTRLPGGGHMLVTARQGVWVVRGDGSRRLLRGYSGATWSPRGLYLGAWRGHELFAIEPGGRVHWSLARHGPIRAAEWSPDGFRIAYLTARSLRVVAGDGTGDTQLRRAVAPVAPAWKPQAPHLLAFAPRTRVVDVAATDVHGLVWRRQLPRAVRSLAWSPDGRVLAVASRGRLTLLDGSSGRVRAILPNPRGFRLASIAFAHASARLAIVLLAPGGRSQALTMNALARRPRPRPLFAGAGSFADVQWSPNDRWILISWPAADQWLFLRATQVSAVRAVGDIARQFDPEARTARFPKIAGWCCG
jgi:Anaphase-promoting complex subunit 4 WD40 domain